MKKISFGFVLFLVLFLFAHEMVDAGKPPVRYCESRSHSYKGFCTSKTNCGNSCRNEGFNGGHCRFDEAVNRRCYCLKPCAS
ncbi:hypothetical protein ACHQM5_026144 [Ranunculus cassubicifolius]